MSLPLPEPSSSPVQKVAAGLFFPCVALPRDITKVRQRLMIGYIRSAGGYEFSFHPRLWLLDYLPEIESDRLAWGTQATPGAAGPQGRG